MQSKYLQSFLVVALIFSLGSAAQASNSYSKPRGCTAQEEAHLNRLGSPWIYPWGGMAGTLHKMEDFRFLCGACCYN